MGESDFDLFGPRTWTPNAKHQPAAAAAVAVPPPVPYKYAGMVVQSGATQQFLARDRDDRVYPAIPGETLDGGYRVESVSAEEIVLVYVPLNARQSVPVSSEIGLETTAPGARGPRASAQVTGAAAGAAQLR